MNWNICIHTVPMLLLILDRYINGARFVNNWPDVLVFTYLIALPLHLGTLWVILAYSHYDEPVYHFLTYEDSIHYVLALLSGGVIVGLHQLCYRLQKPQTVVVEAV